MYTCVEPPTRAWTIDQHCLSKEKSPFPQQPPTASNSLAMGAASWTSSQSILEYWQAWSCALLVQIILRRMYLGIWGSEKVKWIVQLIRVHCTHVLNCQRINTKYYLKLRWSEIEKRNAWHLPLASTPLHVDKHSQFSNFLFVSVVKYGPKPTWGERVYLAYILTS